VNPRARRARVAIAAAIVVMVSSRAAADPVPHTELAPWRIGSASTLTTEGGSTITLPAGVYVLTAEGWHALDVEIMRLQEAEVRLNAENSSLRTSLTEGDGPGWGTLTAFAGGLALGMAAAWYAFEH